MFTFISIKCALSNEWSCSIQHLLFSHKWPNIRFFHSSDEYVLLESKQNLLITENSGIQKVDCTFNLSTYWILLPFKSSITFFMLSINWLQLIVIYGAWFHKYIQLTWVTLFNYKQISYVKGWTYFSHVIMQQVFNQLIMEKLLKQLISSYLCQ